MHTRDQERLVGIRILRHHLGIYKGKLQMELRKERMFKIQRRKTRMGSNNNKINKMSLLQAGKVATI